MVDWIPTAQALLYTMVLVSGLMVCVPLGIMKEDFDGECVLYGKFDGRTNSLQAGNESVCNYVIYSNVILCVLMGGILAAAFIFVLIAEFRGNYIAIRTNFFVVLGQLILHSAVAFLIFISACLMTVGFKELCDDLEEGVSTCKDYQYRRDLWPINTDPKHFWDHSTMALGASWWNLGCWVLLIALETYVLLIVKQGSYPPGAERTTASASMGSLSRPTSKRSVASTSSQRTLPVY